MSDWADRPTPARPENPAPTAPPVGSMARVALVTGIGSVCAFVAGFFLPGAVGGIFVIVSAVSGALAFEWGRRERRNDRRAEIGWICGITVLSFFAMLILMIIVVVASGGSMHRS